MSTSTPVTGRSASPQHIRLRTPLLPKKWLVQLGKAIHAGDLVIFPTETVYGLGASVFCRESIQRIYGLKGRQWRKPLALLVPSLAAAAPLLDAIPPAAEQLAQAFWPGPLTLVLKASPLGRMVTGGLATIGVRVPNHPVALMILRHLNIPLATTSVNRSGEPEALSGRSAQKLFGKQVDWLIDSGTCRGKKPSSVVDVSHYPYTVIREGAIPKKKLEVLLLTASRRSKGLP